MQQLTFVRRGRLEWREVPQPKLEGPLEALVRPLAFARCDSESTRRFAARISRLLSYHCGCKRRSCWTRLRPQLSGARRSVHQCRWLPYQGNADSTLSDVRNRSNISYGPCECAGGDPRDSFTGREWSSQARTHHDKACLLERCLRGPVRPLR